MGWQDDSTDEAEGVLIELNVRNKGPGRDSPLGREASTLKIQAID